MAQDTYFKEDIKYILCALDYAVVPLPLNEADHTHNERDDGFREGAAYGHRKALEEVGLAFGIVAEDRGLRFVSRE